jgi:hypothetical protein
MMELEIDKLTRESKMVDRHHGNTNGDNFPDLKTKTETKKRVIHVTQIGKNNTKIDYVENMTINMFGKKHD